MDAEAAQSEVYDRSPKDSAWPGTVEVVERKAESPPDLVERRGRRGRGVGVLRGEIASLRIWAHFRHIVSREPNGRGRCALLTSIGKTKVLLAARGTRHIDWFCAIGPSTRSAWADEERVKPCLSTVNDRPQL